MSREPRRFVPRDYQVLAEQWALTNPKSGLFLRMGLGKTAICLSLINRLMYDRFEIHKVLVIAPRLVAEDVWFREPYLWEDFKHLTVSLIGGGSAKRRLAALEKRADIYIISRDNFKWLVDHLGTSFDFDMIVVDESQSFKSPTSHRFKALSQVAGYARRIVLLSGTVAPNGLLDLWSQMFVLDRGARLGATFEMYRDWFFEPGSMGRIGKRKELKPTSYVPKDWAEPMIWNLTGQICLSMKTQDYLKLPPLTETIIPVNLGAKSFQDYKTMERDMVLRLDEADIIAGGAAALGNKLLQIALGTAYDDEGHSNVIHSVMLDALDETVQAMEGSVLILYNYRHDLARILERFPKAVHLTKPEQIAAWDRGDTKILVAHPASAGHGLNLQYGGNNVVWFGLPWNLEHFEQANTRVYRQGQENPVTIAYLIPQGTLHEEVYERLMGKAETQDLLMDALKAKRDTYFTDFG